MPAVSTAWPRGAPRTKVLRLVASTAGAGAGCTDEDPRQPAAGGGPRQVVLGSSRAGYFTLNLRHGVAAAVCAALLAIVARMR